MEDNKIEIDESLYSRQQLMLGEEAMKKMAGSTVFLSGLAGLGVEVAKNIALAGVKNLVLHDQQVGSWTDLSTNFYMGPSDIGKNRVAVCVKQISELNPYTKIGVHDADLATVDLSVFDSFTCVILTDCPLDVQLRINEHCHAKGIKFIAADVRGVFTWAFCDFGENFQVMDKNGEENREILISKITKANPGVVTCLNEEKHGFESDDVVTFREIRGMEELNGEKRKITVLSPSTFSIGDTTSLSPYDREGVVQQVKEPLTMNFKSLKESLPDPSLAIVDFAKFESPNQVHIGMQALHLFASRHAGKYPAPWFSEDAKELIKLAEEINANMKNKVEKVDEKLITQLSFTAQGAIVPLSAFMGGMVAQECLKALSGKYTPLNQWMYLDGVEVLPALDSDPASFQPSGNREDGQMICLGKELCEKISNQKIFMVGCGAIGCEMLKNYAMLGIGTGEKGLITITDNDLIEKSNLNRQFLFRSKDIQQPKSETGAKAAKGMNPALKAVAHLDKVGPDTEKKYSDDFFQELDIVVNALDNVGARLYMDQRCVSNKRPLLESGTLGPKGHVQVILPHKTESYGSQRDPPERDVPFCTLKSFPNQIEHCIEWARDFSFGGLFVSKPMQWNQLIEENNLVEKLNSPNGGGVDLKIVRTAVKLLRVQPKSFEDCVRFARLRFESYYTNKTLQLLHTFPLDHKVDDKGTLFWQSPKRPPRLIAFDWDDESNRNFVVSLASLWAEVWGLKPETDLEKMRAVCSSMVIPKFIPKQKRIETDESIKKDQADQQVSSKEEEIEDLLKELAKYFTNAKGQLFKLKPIDFEKDDDSNHHIDFIAATANLRARMYSIQEAARLKIKAIAGRIMPAIATTTACVSGCVMLEFIKIVKGCELEQFKNLFMNLALPYWAFSEPGPAERKKITSDFSYTLWDQWDVKEGDITLGQFIDVFQKRYKLNVGGVFKGAIMVYVPMFPGHAKRKPTKMSVLLKKKPEDVYEDLIVTFTNDKDEDISGPPIRFFY